MNNFYALISFFPFLYTFFELLHKCNYNKVVTKSISECLFL